MVDSPQRKKGGHKPNMHEKRNRARYQADGHLRKNKVRHITAMLVTASGAYAEFLRQRLGEWQTGKA